jgi:hypothetical protein
MVMAMGTDTAMGTVMGMVTGTVTVVAVRAVAMATMVVAAGARCRDAVPARVGGGLPLRPKRLSACTSICRSSKMR